MSVSLENRLFGKTFFALAICQFSFIYFTQAQAKLKTTPAKPAQQPEIRNPYADIDRKALLIPDSLTRTTAGIAFYINASFHLNHEKVRAAFIWVANNIQYDVPNMYAVNFEEKKEDKIGKPLRTRMGICENYAALFTDICEKAGIKSFVIEGYVKQNGQVSNLSHTWCTAKIDSSWYLFDPTWASGVVANGKFIPKINNEFFESKPSVFIQMHMPFDYLWQLSYDPINFSDFNAGITTEDIKKPFFNFPDSIALFEKQSQNESDVASYIRIDNNGPKNAQIFNWLVNLKQRMENVKVSEFNSAVTDYNDAIASYNEFIRYRNKQFIPTRPDADIQSMLDSATIPLKRATLKLDQIKNPGPNIVSLLGPIRRQMSDFSAQAEEQQDWLSKYFSKGRSGRRGMFTKVSWFGIPLN
jgi:Transglutaminase-like superfamily